MVLRQKGSDGINEAIVDCDETTCAQVMVTLFIPTVDRRTLMLKLSVISKKFNQIVVLLATSVRRHRRSHVKHVLSSSRPVHPPHSSVFVTEFNPEYGNTDLLIWLRKRSSPKYGNAHHLNIFFTVISSCACVKNVAPSVGNVHVPLYYARC